MIKASMNWTFLIVGTVIGAGYASGRELWQFFGHGSSLAIFLFVVLFSISCFTIMNLSYIYQSTHYGVILETIVGKSFKQIYDIIILVYLFSTTVVMIAGSGAIGEAFQTSYIWGIAFTITCILIVFSFHVEGFLSLNRLLVPTLVIGLLIILIRFILDEQVLFIKSFTEQQNWLSAFPFTSLNILPLIAVIGAIGHKIKSRAEIWLASICSGMILGIVTFLFNISLIHVEINVSDYEIPLFIILQSYPQNILLIMTVILWIAIFSTAASNLLGIASRLRKVFSLNFISIIFIVLIIVVPLSMIGFTTLISYLYPAYGVINLYVLFKLLMHPLQKSTS
ncbi:MAG TPA: hypothetical protein VK061_05175 [Bacillota bacterium]|nr:hypothetical protein [Bacillota bacterium]